MIAEFREFMKPIYIFRTFPLIVVDGEYKTGGGTYDIDNNYIEPNYKYSVSGANVIVSPSKNNNNFTQDVKTLENSRDLLGYIDIISETEIFNIDIENKQNSDRVIYQNKVYEVLETGFWDFLGMSFYKTKLHLLTKKMVDLITESILAPIPNPPSMPLVIPLYEANEIMSGTINGINDIFSTAKNFLSKYLFVFFNGKRMILNSEYIELDNNRIQIIEPELIPNNPLSQIITCDYWVKL